MLGSVPSLALTMNMAIWFLVEHWTPLKLRTWEHMLREGLAAVRAVVRCSSYPLLRVSADPRSWQCTFPFFLFLFEEDP
jgi:hypothetical protein